MFSHAPVPGNPERVQLSGPWARNHITAVVVPQLARFGISRPVAVHRLAAQPLLDLWTAWESAGLLVALESWDGLFVPRFKRQTGTEKERAAKASTLTARNLSNHTWGTAFDVNARALPLGTVLAKVPAAFRALVPVAERHGWFWGGYFGSRPDPMHFELARLETGSGS